jgi:hypothetical protein
MTENTAQLMCDFIDYLMPEFTPYETSLYLYLLKQSVIKNGSPQVRIGKRTIAGGYGTGSRGVKTNYAHMTEVIKRLEGKGCITIGDTTREGTLYTVVLPHDIPLVREKMAALLPAEKEEDYFPIPKSAFSCLKGTIGFANTPAIRSRARTPLLTTTSRSQKVEPIQRPISEPVA